ncbi:calpastatin [Afipia sp. Root123D2]|uniref:DUF1810 domain-containing protein n=1 Tax=Afipia sp. Root123D2 TaxID=1736436 RepID=UPI0006FBD4B1|nr:DUF1810 domain-containing protein [Afipia sp. Root123D2]KQW19220.1 calpastatin [Afipia sp. Root123D2]
MVTDSFDLERFVDAQAPVYARVVAELRDGQKQSHWMWFIFPQIAGLGYSAMAQRYAIASREEARSYLAHPILGPRLRECTRLVNAIQDRAIEQILGPPDDLKFHSSMTLFAQVATGNDEFAAALGKYYGRRLDQATLDRL